MQSGSNVIMCALDIVKAFDRINHFALPYLMKKKGILAVFNQNFCWLALLATWPS